MADDLVDLTYPSDGVAQLLVDTGGRNFSTFAANEQFLARLRDAREHGATVVVVGSGVEDHFVGHGWLPDLLETFTGGQPSGDPLAGWRGFTELDTGPMISIAAVDGPAWGHGAELAWACDLRVASERAEFGQPEVHVGAIPGSGGTVRLTRLVGESVCLGLVLDGRPIDARRAADLGLVHRVTPEGQALTEAIAWGTWLASRPAEALQAAKRVIKGNRDGTFDEALRREGAAFIELLGREDTQERLRRTQTRYDEGADTPTAFGFG